MTIHKHSNTVDFAQFGELLKEQRFNPKTKPSTLHKETFDLFISSNNLKFHQDFYPQLLAEVAQWDLNPKRDILTQLKTILADSRNCGIYFFCTSLIRCLPVQHEQALYSSATPLMLLAYKLYGDTKYEMWRDNPTLDWITGQLFETITLDLDLTKNRLVELREIGLTIKSGQKSGQKKDSRTTYGLSGLNKTELGQLNTFSQMMLCQTWCYHPAKRHNLMITDPQNWDEPAEALIQDEVFAEPEKIKRTHTKNSKIVIESKLDDVPWS